MPLHGVSITEVADPSSTADAPPGSSGGGGSSSGGGNTKLKAGEAPSSCEGGKSDECESGECDSGKCTEKKEAEDSSSSAEPRNEKKIMHYMIVLTVSIFSLVALWM